MLTELADGIADLIDTAGIAVRKTGTPYGADDIALTVQRIPADPDQLIVLSPYTVSDDPLLNDSVIGVTIRHRGLPNDPLGPQARDDAVFNLLQGIARQTVGGVFVVYAWRQGGGVIGQDQNQRWERSSIWYWRVMYPTTHRTD